MEKVETNNKSDKGTRNWSVDKTPEVDFFAANLEEIIRLKNRKKLCI